MTGCTIAVDHETGIDLLDQISTEQRLQLHTNSVDTDIPGDMSPPIGLLHSETPQRFGYLAPCVVAHENERRCTCGFRYPVGQRIFRAEKRGKLAHELRAPC